jgi:hypothetical protein
MLVIIFLIVGGLSMFAGIILNIMPRIVIRGIEDQKEPPSQIQ